MEGNRGIGSRRVEARFDNYPDSKMTIDELLKQPYYARIRNCSERTIERERASGTGCRYIKIGRAVRYRRGDIFNFVERHVRQSTSEPA